MGAPFEEPLADSFQEHQNFGVAQRLVGKFDGVSLSLHRVREGGQGDSRVDLTGINWNVWDTIYTGAGSWQDGRSWGGIHLSWNWQCP